MHRHLFLGALLAATATSALAQWTDRISIGKGGEPTIATDGKGNVYATGHLPCGLFVSRDWGATFAPAKQFPNGFCDIHLFAWPDGRVNISFIKPGVSGLTSWFSTDNAKTLTEGKGVDGPLDREWLVGNPVNNEVYMDYSNGYIGGPKSKGVFLAASSDGGKTFQERGRADNEKPGSYAVDPHIACSADGKIYAMWLASTDYNNIDGVGISVSTDGGKTFTNHQRVADYHKSWGDCQERWMLGCLAASGKDTLAVAYADYGEYLVDGETYHPLLAYYRVSKDGGKTFSAPKTVSSSADIVASIRGFNARKKDNINLPFYLQTLPWICADPSGRIHIAYEDNRSGQGEINGKAFDKWQVRFATMSDMSKGFGPSEQVSEDVLCNRPPLDFISCAADSKRAYIIWVETPGAAQGWAFSGDLKVARKILPSASSAAADIGG